MRPRSAAAPIARAGVIAAEHTLVDCKGEVGNIAGLLCQNTFETDIVEIANKFVSSPRESK